MYTLLALAAAYDGRVRGWGEAAAWREMFDGWPVSDVRAAILTHYRTSRFPVTPADIIQIIEEGS